MMKMKSGLSIRAKLFCAFFFSSAIISLAISYTLFLHMRTNHLDTLKRDLYVIADLASAQADKAVIDRLPVNKYSPASQNDKSVVDWLSMVAKPNRNITKVYILQKTATPGEYAYAAAVPKMPSAYQNAQYKGPFKTAIAAGFTKVTVAEEKGNRDHIAVFAPLRNSLGDPVAVLCMELDGVALLQNIRHFAFQVLVVALAALWAVGLISWLLAAKFTKRLEKLYTAMDDIAAGRNEIALSENWEDEMSLLAVRLRELAEKLQSEREEILVGAVESLVRALEAKDAYTYGHSSRVSEIALEIARKLQLPKNDIFTLQMAALLHDIGKIGIPDQVLNKPGKPTNEEWLAIRQHPEQGAKILGGIPALTKVTEIVRHHHARWDGHGYPEAIAGMDIPLAARIITVADTFEAMTSDRSYRKGMEAEAAMAEIRRCAGSQFDPSIVEVFVGIYMNLVMKKL
jgi:putative nucleotidyltransferase with HDIG domain